MNISFDNLPEDKKNKIIQSALNEFAAKGYERASTNVIVENAEISKGLLFYYFKSKKGLYIFLLNYVIPIMYQKFYEYADMNITDFFERLKNWQVAKLTLFEKLPLETKFLIKAFTDIPKELKNDILIIYSKYTQDGFRMIFDNIDYSNFRNDIDKQKAINTIIWTLESYGNKYMKENLDEHGNLIIKKDVILNDISDYIEILKYGVKE
ncbi:transcriptional regulator, TetR family [Caloramator quimbayensis]|uniref:Transcriptional regulator, TetR family n=1 Tax=Caloramator quimbayensis TaxID=1147123 RepID=A0A1T4WQU6_9CLOT|nr:TetR/AcrR family transcriptional regulator [Caloramator quimbayensis]SKA79487.1 transcriptional regulator, TetR family [Caloramator quimbayensis]